MISNPTTGPTVKRGRSRQDYATPFDFIRAVESRFGRLSFDLAATDQNYKGPEGCYFDLEDDSLKQNWDAVGGLLWCNLPFGLIGPWVQKAAGCASARILMLTPASVGSNWFADFVHQRAAVLFLRPRLIFEGADDPYPKDLMLLCWRIEPCVGYQCWKWK